MAADSVLHGTVAGRVNKVDKKLKSQAGIKKRVINMDYGSAAAVDPPTKISIRDRLGASTRNVVSASAIPPLMVCMIFYLLNTKYIE